MKIALVSGEYPPMEGGVGAFTQEMARAFSALNNEVHLITSRDAAPEQLEKKYLGRHAEPVDLGYAQLHARINRWRWPSVASVADLTLRHEFDVVNIQYQAAAYNMNSAGANLMPWRLKHIVKTIVTFHDLRTPYLFPKAGFLRSRAVTFMARQATGVIVTNEDDFEALQERAVAAVATIPIGSNIDIYRANHVEIEEARELLGLNESDMLIGYFGFVNESKGADILLQALSLLPPSYHLVFIGGKTGSSDGSNEVFLATVEASIADLGLADRVHWTGFMPEQRVSTYLQTADIMVMPYRDGVSLRRGTLMAALAHGRPGITTLPEKNVPELQHGKNIWLVPANDPPALADSIRHLAQDRELRLQLSKNAQLLAENFSWDKIAQRTLSFYQNLEDPRSKRAY